MRTTSTTEPATPAASLPLGARWIGALLTCAGMLLASSASLMIGALGLELLAGGFWIWARAAEDRDEQLARWAWLRRPAAAVWLAAAIELLLGRSGVALAFGGRGLAEPLRWIQAAAVVWAGLELLAALPHARPFSERPGPLRTVGPWLPVLLPAAGFALLWRHSARWVAVPQVRQVALFLLVLTAVLAILRAFHRGRWVASLRWLVVVDSALAASLVALAIVPREVSLLLWLGACGGHAMLLAGELRSAAPRRTAASHAMWRLAGWAATTSLSWPLLVTLGFGRPGIAHATYALAITLVVVLSSWVTVSRLVEAPERRALVRREAAISLAQVGALLTLMLGPSALAMAWWSGFEPAWPGWAVSLLPAALSGALAWRLGHHLFDVRPAWLSPIEGWARRAAGLVYRLVTAIEHRLVRLFSALARAVIAPTRDLHTGDAQEYLLFLMGLSVLALVLPLLQ